MLEVCEHSRTYGENGTENYPEVIGQSDDGVGRRVYVKDCDEEREREGEKCHDGENTHRFVLLGGEERIVGLAKLMERFGGAHDVIMYAVVFVGDSTHVRTEVLAEKLRAARFEIAQHLAVRLDALAQIEEVARAAGYARDHRHFVAGENVFLDDAEVVLYIFDFVLHRAV